MEQRPHTPQGGTQQNEAHPSEQLPPEHLTDDHLIHYHITEALREDRPIDHGTARAIAAQLHGGQASPLYALASSGAVVEGLSAELDTWREDNETGVEVEPWLDALDEYLAAREDPNPVDGWAKLWPTPPPGPETPGEPEHDPDTLACEIGHQVVNASVEAGTEDDEATTRAALLDRLNAAAVTTLGQVATVVGGTVEGPEVAPDERDDIPWTDAARWSTAEIALNDHDERHYLADELDELFAATPDEQVGTVDENRQTGAPGR